MARTARRSRRVLAAAIAVEHQQVGLDGLVAAVARFAGRCLEIIDGAHRRPIDHFAVEIFGAAGSDYAATRPVYRDAVAHRAAEEFIDWHAERLALDIQAGVENGAGGV